MPGVGRRSFHFPLLYKIVGGWLFAGVIRYGVLFLVASWVLSTVLLPCVLLVVVERGGSALKYKFPPPFRCLPGAHINAILPLLIHPSIQPTARPPPGAIRSRIPLAHIQTVHH